MSNRGEPIEVNLEICASQDAMTFLRIHGYRNTKLFELVLDHFSRQAGLNMPLRDDMR